MQAESLEALENAAVPPAQARAIVRAIEIEIAGAKDTLATKHDVLLQGAELRAEFHRGFGEFRAEVQQSVGAFRAEVQQGLGALRAELQQSNGEHRREIAGVVRQMYLAILGQMAVMLGFAYFFATHLR